jgi:hypothetical protein
VQATIFAGRRDFGGTSISEFFNGICAMRPAGVDVKGALRIAAVDDAVRGRAVVATR